METQNQQVNKNSPEWIRTILDLNKNKKKRPKKVSLNSNERHNTRL